MRRQEEKKAFVDFSKTEDGKRIFENNKSIWKNQNFLEHIQSLKNPQEIELAQIIRRYQSSFNWIQKEVEHIKAFQIRHTPTARPEDLALTFDLTEGYLWLEVLKPEKYPEEPASFVLLNHSVPRDFRRWFEKDLFDNQIETKSIMRTLKYMDNNLDKICQKIQNNIAKGVEIDPKPVAKVVPVKEKPVEKPQQKVEEKAQVKEAPQDKKVKEGAQEKTQATWTQDEQKLLEQGIVKYKDIKDAKEKWEKIASDIPGRTMSECVQRFKDCRKAAEEKKNQVEEHKGNSPRSNEEEDDEDEEDESGEEEGSEEASDNTSDENIEEQKANRKIRDYQEYETAIDSIVLAKSVRYDNVSVGALISIQVQVSCKGCNCIHEAEAVKEPDSDYLVNNDKCPKCAHKNRLVAKQELFHEHSNAICSMGSFTWDIRDLHFCEFDLTCEFCDTANRTKKIIASQPIYMECKGCFKKMQFSYMALTLNALHYGDDDDTAEDANGTDVKDIIKKMFAKKTKFEFKQGFPLPNLGGCKHYKNSNRYFRFPCCGKAYPCDDCHSKVEKHEMQVYKMVVFFCLKYKLAKSMICGFCSTEQPIGDVCKKCGKAVKKIVRNTAYWEGGQGTRNATAMSRRDPHKYKGLGKTVSTKKKNQMKQKAK